MASAATQRPPTAKRPTKAESPPATDGDDPKAADGSGGKKAAPGGLSAGTQFMLHVLAVAAVVAYLPVTYVLYAPVNDWVASFRDGPESPGGHRFTAQEVARYDGKGEKPLYLVILGQVFDVTKGRRHYDGEGGYNVFIGQDASRSFISGEFEGEGVTSDVSGLEPHEMKGLLDWRSFYHKEYTYKGYLPGGPFYDSRGNPTAMLREVGDGAKEAERLEAIRKANEKKHPPCNTKWTATTGGEVWCKEGYPRLTVEYIDDVLPKDQNQERKSRERCACFETRGWSDMRRVYKGCKPDAQWCKIIKD